MLMMHAGEHQPAIWQLLDRWGLEGSPWGGPPLSALQHYSECSWRIPSGVEGGLGGQDMGQALIQELHWEAEAKLMNILTFITTRELTACT